MQAKVRVWRTLSFVLLTIAACLRGESTASADAAPTWTDAQLVGFADVIVRGRTTRVAAGRDDLAGPIYTYVSLQVTGILKGTIADANITIKQLGGRVGARELRIAGQPAFAVGEDVLLFLEIRPRDRTLTITAGSQGKFTITHDGAGDVATRASSAARGALGGHETRPLDAWLADLARLIGPASRTADITLVPRESAAAVDGTPASSKRPQMADTSRRIDLIAPGDALSDGGDRVLRRAADFWTGTGLSSLLPGGLQPAGCFTTNVPDNRIAVGVDGCQELSRTGGTIAVSGAWLEHDGSAAPRFLGGGVIVNTGAVAKQTLSRSGCVDQLVTHEIGHALGLGDLPDGSGVMGRVLECDAGFGKIAATPAGAAAKQVRTGGEQTSTARPLFIPLDAEDASALSCVIGCNVSAAAGISVPLPPTNLAFTLTGSTLTLTWAAPPADGRQAVMSYVIEAGTSSGGTDVANFSTGSTATTFSAVVGGSAVFYIRVRAANFYGPSDPSNEIRVVVGNPVERPGPPQSLAASASGSNVTLTWGAPATGGATSAYIIEAGSSPGTANLANFSTGSTATSYFAPGVGAGTYFVRVRAANAAGASDASNEVVVIVGSACTAPTAPSNLAGSIAGSNVTLTWSAGLSATSYRLQAGSSPGLSDLADFDLGSAATTLVATNVGSGTYFVRVRSVNSCATSDPSNELVVIVK